MSRNGFRLAVGTLTVVRVPPPTQVDRGVAREAMLLAPVVALLPATIAFVGCLLAAAIGMPPLVASALVVGAVALTSRGLHLDGLADTADGLASGYDHERALAVMRRGDIGPAGAVTALIVVLTQAAAVAALFGSWRGALLVAAAVVASRGVLAMCCAAKVPSARPDGLGATVAGTVPVAAAVAVGVAVVTVTSLAAFATGTAWWRGGLAVVVGFAAALLLLRRCVHRLGGVTGDVLGACVEVTLAGALAVLASAPPGTD